MMTLRERRQLAHGLRSQSSEAEAEEGPTRMRVQPQKLTDQWELIKKMVDDAERKYQDKVKERLEQ